MKRTLTLAALAASAGFAVQGAQAQVAISGAIGTPGVTAGIQGGAKYLQLRGDYNYLKYSHEGAYDGTDYDGHLKLSTFGVFADLHPLGNGFLISGGAYVGDKNIRLDSKTSGSFSINGTSFSAAQVGTLSGEAKLKNTAPFVGLGWDTTLESSSHWGFKFVAGAMYTGKPDVHLTSTGGTLSNDPTFQSQVAAEQARVAHDINDFKYYPVVQAGISYRF